MITSVNSQDHQKFMYNALYLDALRGMDATGLMTVDSLGDITVNKKALPSADFLQLKRVDDQISDYSNRVFIGHNRWATRGAINDENSHPFQHGKITLVHNGSLLNTHTLPDHRDFNVDSENIAHSINKIGVHETLKLLDGAFTLIWWDDGEKRVKMVRNAQRPLHLAKIAKKNTIIWASEKDMLSYVAGRSGLEIEDTWELPTKNIVTFDPKAEDIWECEEEETEFYTFQSRGYNYGAGFQGHGQYIPFSESKEEREKREKETEAKREKALTKLKERDILSKKMFEDVGITKGERVRIFLYDFKPFNPKSPTLGVWEGCTAIDPYVTVVVYGSNKDAFVDGEEYIGESLCMQLIDHDMPNDSLINYRMVIDSKGIEEYEETTYAEQELILYKESKEKIIEVREKKFKEDSSDRDDTETADIDFLYIMGPRGVSIPSDEWYKLTKHGCGMCAQDIPIEDASFIEWWGEGKDSPVCTSCLDDCAKNAKKNYGDLH